MKDVLNENQVYLRENADINEVKNRLQNRLEDASNVPKGKDYETSLVSDISFGLAHVVSYLPVGSLSDTEQARVSTSVIVNS